jgi:hypothetical protein
MRGIDPDNVKSLAWGFLGAAILAASLFAYGQWRSWVVVRDFVLPIVAQQAAQRAQQAPPATTVPQASPSPGK